MKASLEFHGERITTILYEVEPNQGQDEGLTEIGDTGLGISMKMLQDAKNDNLFALHVAIKIQNVRKDGFMDLKMIVESQFEFNKAADMSLEQKKEIIGTNGMAILIPYIRSHISTLTTIDMKSSHVLLPLINTGEAWEKLIEKDELDFEVAEVELFSKTQQQDKEKPAKSNRGKKNKKRKVN